MLELTQKPRLAPRRSGNVKLNKTKKGERKEKKEKRKKGGKRNTKREKKERRRIEERTCSSSVKLDVGVW